ncbi:MAG: hypothetical protein HDS11_04175 [Bacteroides sp.]|nr:hypothetical protein [Bacteroides sp.]
MNNKIQDYIDLIDLDYESAVKTLIKKYGAVTDDYFREKSYYRFFAGEIKSITKGKYSRTKDGLYCHHIAEDKYLNLTNKDFCKQQNVPYDVHKKENLVYCDLIEHLILHFLIAEKTNGEYGKPGAISYLLPTYTEWYVAKKHLPTYGWIKTCYDSAYLPKNDALSLFNQIKDRLSPNLAKYAEKTFKFYLDYFEHEDEIRAAEEKRTIHRVKNYVAPTLFNHEINKLDDLSKEASLLSMQALQEGSTDAKIFVNKIIGQWLINELQAVIETKDRKLHPQRWENLDKIVRFAKEREAIKAKEDELKLEKSTFKEFHNKYPYLQNLDVDEKVSRDKLISLLYQEKYNRAYKTKKDYKKAALNTLREDLIIELNSILSNKFENEEKLS